VDIGRTKHPDGEYLVRWKADLGSTAFKVQALPPFDLLTTLNRSSFRMGPRRMAEEVSIS